MTDHPIVAREQWIAARKALLAEEKALTRERDRIAAARRALPWVRMDKPYVFHAPEGEKALADLFKGRSQLVVYHFMLAPGWKEGCVSCSFLADHFDGADQHLRNHDVSLVAVSRAPLAEIEAYKRRMGWRFRWVSSFGSDFNSDFGVSFDKKELDAGKVFYNFAMSEGYEELPGLSVFHRDDSGAVFHTYSTYARGLDELIGAYTFLDRTPNGRNETVIMDWIKRHDRYDAGKGGSCHGG